MKSDIPKVATELAGRPLLLHVLDSLIAAGFRRICIIVGYRRDMVEAIVPEYPDTRIEFAHQAEQKGTAHAFLCARDALADFQGPVLVACGDMPMIRAQ
ncbi:MAG: NTP transferase domain-containing protein, partial [Leptospiraceae bacterium]|nr:NTP transferase domain-containing protein [Leptospiraceae bacterium]